MVRFFNSAFLTLSVLIQLIYSLPVTFPKSHDFLVKELPGLSNIPENDRPIMYAGHIELDNVTDTNYFFWKFIKKDTNFNRTIIWLNGGPGCSSMDGVLMEVGPLRVNNEETLDLNNGSWYHSADMLFVDQPGGTGFSITEAYEKDLYGVGDEFVVFLKNYFESFPDEADNEIYIAGESYAGQYIPYIAQSIIESNDSGEKNINLRGLLIGNGWIEPNIQSLSYVPYLLDSGIISNQDKFFPSLLQSHERCQNKINNPDSSDRFSIAECDIILTKVLSFTRDKSAKEDEQCINMYDTRLRDSYPSCGMNWPPTIPYVTSYLQQEAVVTGLNLNISKVKAWRECDGEVSKTLKNKHSKPSFHLLEGLLQRVEIILFNGNRDIICNNKGVWDTISNLEWAGSKGFTEEAIEYDWQYDGDVTGWIIGENNLTFVDVFESSHMVPFDKPYESRGIFDIIIGNYQILEESNSTYIETPVYGKVPTEDSDVTDDNKEDDDQKNGEDNEPASGKSHKSFLPFLLYLVTIGLIGIGLYFYNKSKQQKSNSILRNNRRVPRHHGKKTVSWADENNNLTSNNDSYESASIDLGERGKFLNNFQSTEPGKDHHILNNDGEYEDIELQTTSQTDNDHDIDFNIDDESESEQRR